MSACRERRAVMNTMRAMAKIIVVTRVYTLRVDGYCYHSATALPRHAVVALGHATHNIAVTPTSARLFTDETTSTPRHARHQPIGFDATMSTVNVKIGFSASLLHAPRQLLTLPNVECPCLFLITWQIFSQPQQNMPPMTPRQHLFRHDVR